MKTNKSFSVDDSSTWTDTDHPFSKSKLRKTFKSPYEDESKHNGRRFKVLGLSSRKDFDMDEVGAYFLIQFLDGKKEKMNADPIEIYKNVGTVGGKPW